MRMCVYICIYKYVGEDVCVCVCVFIQIPIKIYKFKYFHYKKIKQIYLWSLDINYSITN